MDSFQREAWLRWWLTPWELELYGLSPGSNAGAFLSKRAWDRVVRPSLNDERWRLLTGNKLIYGSYFRDWGITTPRSLGFLAPGRGFTLDGQRLDSVASLASWLRTNEQRSFVMKPISTGAGFGIAIIEDMRWVADSVVFLTADGRDLTEGALASELSMTNRGMTGYVIQERLRQHPAFRELSDAPSNSLRVVTWAPEDEEPTVQMAILRLGRRGNQTDNWSHGGIAVGVDLTTGQLRSGRSKPEYGGWTDTHPDTGAVIPGRALPYWQETCDLVCRAALVTPGLRSVGWDVVITEGGPVLIEGNARWGIQSLQVHCGGIIGTAVGNAWAGAGADLPDGSGRWSRRNWWRVIRPPRWRERVHFV